MKKNLVMWLLFVLSIAFVPGLVSAQADIDPNPSGSECVSLSNNLRYQDRDANKSGEVSTLQDFLQSKGFLNSEPTGYFGLLTQKAVKDFQNANGITPASGYVGPITRAKIRSLTCGDIIINPPPPPPDPTPSITILSPNGGETWIKGTTKTIEWRDKAPLPTCPFGTYCAQSLVAKSYDIKLVPYYSSSCTGNVCSSPIIMPYTIAGNIYGFSYNWPVGKVLYTDYLSDKDIPDGSYTVQVCQTNTSTCDSSDSYFKIVSPASTTPVISGVSGPQTLNVNQTGTWTVKASDSSGGTLTYSVNWGDSNTTCPSGFPCATTQSLQQSATFTHSYSQTGTYTPTFTVTNSSGQSAKASLSVKVESTTTPSITVLSPNGGETYTSGSPITVKWQTNNMLASFILNVIRLRAYPNGQEYNLAYNVLNGSQEIVVPSFVPVGAYTLEIKTYVNGVLVMDSSDSYFKIVAARVNQSPRITSHPVSGAGVNVGVPANYTFVATDPDNDPLTWFIDWGDGTTTSSNASSCWANCFQFTTSHSWSKPGTYEVLEKVLDSKGGYDSFNFNVIVSYSSITLLSPNGGETFVQSQNRTISINWKGGVYPVQVGVVKDTFPQDMTVVGWINTKANADGTLGWDGERIGPLDYLTTGAWSVIQPGKYKILVVSKSPSGNYCISAGSDCVYDVSDAPFTITSSAVANHQPIVENLALPSTPASGQVVGFKADKLAYIVGETATFEIVVTNNGSATWSGLGPVSGTTYLQSQDFNTLGFPDSPNAGRTRVAVGSGYPNYPWRWDTGNLTRDEIVSVTGNVKWEKPGTYTLCAGLVQEFKQWMDLEKFCKIITVTSPTVGSILGSSLSANALSALNNESSQAEICGEFTITLSKGMDNLQVKCLQKTLNQKGFKVAGTEASAETTYFGEATFAAVQAFQTANNLAADGVFGPDTQAVLRNY